MLGTHHIDCGTDDEEYGDNQPQSLMTMMKIAETLVIHPSQFITNYSCKGYYRQ